MTKFILILIITLFPLSALGQDILNYPVGECKQIEGELYQQLSDGTWADPYDELNTCQRRQTVPSWTNDPQYNPWLRYGEASNHPYWDRGHHMTQQEWFQRCVVMQTLLPLPECQGIYGFNNWTNPGYSQGYGYGNPLDYTRIGRNTVDIGFGDDDYSVNASVSYKPNRTIDSILYGLSMGWVLNQLTK